MKVFYIVENTGHLWKGYSPFTDYVIEASSYEDLVERANIQFMVGFPKKEKLKLQSCGNDRKLYKAYITKDTLFPVDVTRRGTGTKEIWGLIFLPLKQEINYQCSYNMFKSYIKANMGLTLPRKNELQLSYQEQGYQVFSISRKKGLPESAWYNL